MKPLRYTMVMQQRGVALIMAILIVALATILAISVATDGYMDQRRSSTVLLVDQAYEAALGGESFAAEVLLLDAQDKNHSQYDGPDEAWATPVTLPLEDGIGDFKGNLEDLQGRFNLNNLVTVNGSISEPTLAQFNNLLYRLGIDTRWAGIIADWIDTDNSPHFPDGGEDSVYSLQVPPYLTANRPITHTSELLAVIDAAGKPFGLDNYHKLEPFVTALPIDTPLNVCTASYEVLDSMAPSINEYSTPEGQANLITSRKEGCFPKVADITHSFQGDADFNKLMTARTKYLDVKSSYFRANILVSIGTTELAMYSVIQRSDTGKVHVIMRSFGSP